MYDPDKVHIIEERTYTEWELSDLYDFWKSRCMTDDIEDAVDQLTVDVDDLLMAAWLESNRDTIIRRLEDLKPAFEREQDKILSSHSVTTFCLAQSRIWQMYREACEAATTVDIAKKAADRRMHDEQQN